MFTVLCARRTCSLVSLHWVNAEMFSIDWVINLSYSLMHSISALTQSPRKLISSLTQCQETDSALTQCQGTDSALTQCQGTDSALTQCQRTDSVWLSKRGNLSLWPSTRKKNVVSVDIKQYKDNLIGIFELTHFYCGCFNLLYLCFFIRVFGSMQTFL
jgi:hypothetical protein